MTNQVNLPRYFLVRSLKHLYSESVCLPDADFPIVQKLSRDGLELDDAATNVPVAANEVMEIVEYQGRIIQVLRNAVQNAKETMQREVSRLKAAMTYEHSVRPMTLTDSDISMHAAMPRALPEDAGVSDTAQIFKTLKIARPDLVAPYTTIENRDLQAPRLGNGKSLTPDVSRLHGHHATQTASFHEQIQVRACANAETARCGSRARDFGRRPRRARSRRARPPSLGASREEVPAQDIVKTLSPPASHSTHSDDGTAESIDAGSGPTPDDHTSVELDSLTSRGDAATTGLGIHINSIAATHVSRHNTHHKQGSFHGTTSRPG